MEKVRPWCGQPSDRGRLKIRSDCDIQCFWCCWLGGKKGVQPVETEWCGTGVVICLERGADLHMAQLMPLPLASVKSRLVLPFWYRLTWVVPDKGPLNVCLNCFKTMLKFVHNCGTVKVVFCSRMSLIRLPSRWWPCISRVVMCPWSSVWFLHHICSLVYILCFDNICFPSPHLSFFLHFFLSYLFLRIDLLRFLARRRLNLTLVFLYLFCVVHVFWLANAFFCCVRLSFFHAKSRDWFGGKVSRMTYFVLSGM